MTGQRRPILIVVPVYAGLESLLRCAEALIATVDQHVDSVLFVNDDGPDADLIERELLAKIESQPAFRYERNARNLGFVMTCNRAVRELAPEGPDILLLNSDTVVLADWLDELAAALAADAGAGIACARSDAATIATIPFRRLRPEEPPSRDRTLTVHAVLRDLLPRSTRAPVAMGFCLLVRREVIERVGLFDEAFSPGYGEENDLCLRAARVGIGSTIAHRSLVLHEGGQSFGARRARLRLRHEALLVRRHPGYHAAVREYLDRGADPVDVFADALVPDDGPGCSSSTSTGRWRPTRTRPSARRPRAPAQRSPCDRGLDGHGARPPQRVCRSPVALPVRGSGTGLSPSAPRCPIAPSPPDTPAPQVRPWRMR